MARGADPPTCARGRSLVRSDLRVPRMPLPTSTAGPCPAVTSRGKHLLIELASSAQSSPSLVPYTTLGMDGAWRIFEPTQKGRRPQLPDPSNTPDGREYRCWVPAATSTLCAQVMRTALWATSARICSRAGLGSLRWPCRTFARTQVGSWPLR